VTSRPILALAAGLTALSGCASGMRAHQTPAKPAQIKAFLAQAKQGSTGTFTLTYDVTVRYGHGIVRPIAVIVAQRSIGLFSYRMTPSLDLSGPGGPPASSSYEVFYESGANKEPGAGIYSCRKQLVSSPWICQGPYTGIGMGGMQELIGPYPPQALLLGLDNAAVTYTGVPAPPAIRPEPAFLTTRRISGQVLRCLQFGPTRAAVGSVCLRPDGLIASYRLSESATSGAWASAVLRSYSPDVPRDAFELPAKPTSVS
jgi:hypothetical protein